MSDTKYKAFITYSHADAKIAAWLQKSLETYRLPAHIAEARGGADGRRLGRFFRDRNELPAGSDLGHSIRTALRNSEYLIVVCSPEAARSTWVNVEIDEFKKSHTVDDILCLIVSGEPFVSAVGGDTQHECFPASLEYTPNYSRHGYGANEPIAADLRDGGDGRRLAKLKVVSGLLGIGLDELVQRDSQRRYRRMLAITAGSLCGMLVMALLSIAAVDARNDEQARRAEAEDLIEFMLGDLRNRLDEVGRLDVLDAVGEKAIEYYSQADLSEHSDASLGRRARAFHLLGEVEDLRGDMDAARSAFEEAFASTRELIRRSPGDGQLIFDHAQSVFWVGYLDWRLGNLADAETAFTEYLSLAERLVTIDGENSEWLIEKGHANLNLGVYTLESNHAADAIPYFEQALSVYRSTLESDPYNADWAWQTAQAHAWLADAYENAGNLSDASAERLAELEIYGQVLSRDPNNQDVRLSLMSSLLNNADLSIQQGNVGAAVEQLREARRYGEELHQLDAENTLVSEQLAVCLADLAEALTHQGSADEAMVLFKEAEKIAVGLVDRDTSVLDWQTLRQTVRLQRVGFVVRSSFPQADPLLLELEHAVDDLRELFRATPGAVEIRHLLSEAYLSSGEAHRLAESNEEADRFIRSAIELLAETEMKLPPNSLGLLSRAYRLSGDDTNANALDAILRSMGYRHPTYVAAPDD